MPGPMELVLILLIVLLIFGAGKLPAIGDALGRSIKNFKRSASGETEIEVSEKREIGAGAGRSQLKGGGGGVDDDYEADVIAKKKVAAKASADDE